MKAVTWRGVNEVGVEDVPEPKILNDHDLILEVGLSATCGSDLHLVGGYIPAMRAVDQRLQVIGRAVTFGRREREHAVIAPIARAAEGADRHQDVVGVRVDVIDSLFLNRWENGRWPPSTIKQITCCAYGFRDAEPPFFCLIAA